MIEYKCTRCGAQLESPETAVGQQDNCPACGIANTVPTKSQIDTLTLIVVLAGIGGAAAIVAAIIGWQYYSGRTPAGPQRPLPQAAPPVPVTQRAAATAPTKPAAPVKPPVAAPKPPVPATRPATKPAPPAPAPESKPPKKEPAAPAEKPVAPKPNDPPAVVELPADPNAPAGPPAIIELPTDPNAGPPAVVDLPANPGQPAKPPTPTEDEPAKPEQPATPEPAGENPPPVPQPPAPAAEPREAPITSRVVDTDAYCQIEGLQQRTELIIPTLKWTLDAAATDFTVESEGKLVPCRGICIELASAAADDAWVRHQPASTERQKLQKIPGGSQRDAFTGQLRVTMVQYVWMYPKVVAPPIGRKARIVLIFPGKHPAPVLRYKGRMVQDQTR